MLAIEDAFDLELPDEMLTREVFRTVNSMSGRDRVADGWSVHMSTSTLEKELRSSVRKQIGHDVVAPLASETMIPARFPSEAIAALREDERCRSWCPSDLGGAGTSLGVVATLCFELARHCGPTAMVFAMHQIQVATLASHARRCRGSSTISAVSP